MSTRELDRFKTIQALAEGRLAASLAAARLEPTWRQVNRLFQRFLTEGPQGLVSRQCGKPGNYQLPAGVAESAVAIIRER
ncbi:hypothetical protein [Massilia sp. GCM10023247]|uniref:hypothetical protein n=1 Tax=Massilia sp. GCM10023247 TaxID=3252643 RepID=UPI0036171800